MESLRAISPAKERYKKRKIIEETVISNKQRNYRRNLLRYLSTMVLFVSHFKSSVQNMNFFLLDKCSERQLRITFSYWERLQESILRTLFGNLF